MSRIATQGQQAPTGDRSILFLFVQRIMPAANRLEEARREFDEAIKAHRKSFAYASIELRRKVLFHEIEREQQRATLWPAEPSTLSPALLRLASARSPYARSVDAGQVVNDSLILARGITAAVRSPFEFRLYAGPRYAIRGVREAGSNGQPHGMVVREGVALFPASTLVAVKRDGTREMLCGISPSAATSVLRELPEIVATLDHELTQRVHEYRDAIAQLRAL
ncbi:MAG: hypothetical protein KGM44_04975 [bacterium]|nr:hypothetical protein [bacterium]